MSLPTIFSTFSISLGMRPPTGSSKSKSFGFVAIAEAIINNLSSKCVKLETILSATSIKPTNARASFALEISLLLT